MTPLEKYLLDAIRLGLNGDTKSLEQHARNASTDYGKGKLVSPEFREELVKLLPLHNPLR